MEECALSPVDRDHPWKTATQKRMAWAHSRDSWPAPGLGDPLNNATTTKKPGTASETGPIPNKITSWLRECRTPLGASLDEQCNSPCKGQPRNGCSFEDDLSLGADACLFQSSSAKPDPSNYDMQTMEKRKLFKQKGRSMNSTGSGKSSGTLSSVSELLDLYEEDPEEILYNLGFGREEPDIASKIPSRFFNTSSSAKGIDIKVYLGAQMQRMELENPNYALTSRFRQTEVLATVANVFSEIYSQVSGRPLQKICPREAEPKEPAPLRRNNSTLNAVKILKKNISRPNLMALAEIMSTQPTDPTNSDPEGTKNGVCEPLSDAELKQKAFRRKDSSLATVTEETNQLGLDCCDLSTEEFTLANGEQLPQSVNDKPEDVSETAILVKEQSNGEMTESKSSPITEKQKPVFTPDKEPCSILPNPHIAHLLTQPRDSFEMEELQSNEDEVGPSTHCYSREGSEPLLRTTSQQSDSSGFAEDPSTEGSVNYLKVQESSDSCDSETTVTSHTVGRGTSGSLENPVYERLLLDEQLLVQTSMGLFGSIADEKVPGNVSQQGPGHCVMDKTRPDTLKTAESELEIHDRITSSVIEASSSTDSLSTVESADPDTSTELASVSNIPDPGTEASTVGEQAHPHSTSQSISYTPVEPVLDDAHTADQSSDPVPESSVHEKESLSTTVGVHGARLCDHQRKTSCEEQRGQVWIRSIDLLRNLGEQERNPLQRSCSLPNSLQNQTRVVSSVHIQLGQGSVKQCTSPSYSYSYDGESEEAKFLVETEGRNSSHRYMSDLVDGHLNSLNPDTELNRTRRPPYPLNVHQHLSQSTSSLYSIPADWPLRHMTQAPVWSTNSVPDLSQHTRIPHPAIPRHIQQEFAQFQGPVGSHYHKPFNPPSHSHTPVQSPYHFAQSGLYSQYPQQQNSQFPHPVYTPPPGSPFPPKNMAYTHPQSMPYNPSMPFQSPPLASPYGSSFNLHLHAGSNNSQAPLTHANNAPCSLAYGSAPYNSMPYGHQCNSPFHTPPSPFFPTSASFPSDISIPSSNTQSMEMQLRRVLHEIRGAVQSFGQSASEQRSGTPSVIHSPQKTVQPLYEELQKRRRNLNVFRTQMMDLELALFKQQSMVYQLLTPDERQEAEQLQRLRVAVRQELQELELQMEDQLLTLDDHFHSARSSHLYRHPLDMSRGRSMDSLANSPALRATEPVSDLLREQMYLQSELSYGDSGAIDSPTSARSSRSVSPAHSRDLSDLSMRRGGVYRSTVSITPSIPTRAKERGAESQEQTTRNLSPNLPEVSAQKSTHSVSDQDSHAEEPLFKEDRRGGDEARGNVQMQQIIQQIKQSLTEEIRKEIINELLAAVLPRRSPVAPQESAP